MKRTVLNIVLFFLLLGSVHNFYAVTLHGNGGYTSMQRFTFKKPIKFSNKELSTTLLEDTDIDFEEEHLGNDDFKDSGSDRLFLSGSGVHNLSYLEVTNPFVLNRFTKKGTALQPFYGYAIPLYIAQRAMRI